MKEKKQHGHTSAATIDEDSTSPQLAQQAQRLEARNRKLAGKAKHALEEQAHRALEGAELGANLFQSMVRADNEKEIHKKIHPEIADKIIEGVVDKVGDKVKDALTEISDVGKEMAGKATSIYGAIKGKLEARVQMEKDLTVLRTADIVMSGLLEAATVTNRQLKEHIAALSQEKLVFIAEEMWQLKEAARKDPSSQADSPENGSLADGAQEMFLTDIVGMPKGGGVAAEDLALKAYSEFQAGVRDHAMSNSEREDAIQHRLANPNEDKDKLKDAEDNLGPETKASIEKDVSQKQRTDMAMKGQS